VINKIEPIKAIKPTENAEENTYHMSVINMKRRESYLLTTNHNPSQLQFNSNKSNNHYHSITFVLDLPILNKNYKMK